MDISAVGISQTTGSCVACYVIGGRFTLTVPWLARALAKHNGRGPSERVRVLLVGVRRLLKSSVCTWHSLTCVYFPTARKYSATADGACLYVILLKLRRITPY